MTQYIVLLGLGVTTLVFIQVFAVLLYFLLKNYKVNENDLIKVKGESSKKAEKLDYGKFHGVLTKSQIFDFLDFDEIVDGMIVRKKGQVFVMAIQCFGVNYDLSSNNDKIVIEQGFQQFLNVLKYPVQLYVQTRMVNFKDIIEGYKTKANKINQELAAVNEDLQKAKNSGDKEAYNKLIYEKRRKENMLEYAEDAIRTTSAMSSNKNVLERKNYVIISYHKGDLGPAVSNYSEDEIKSRVLKELTTRAKNLIDALGSAKVSGKILDSEELIELVFAAYNRDDTQFIQVSEYLDAEYDSFYSKSKDVYLKERELIEEEIQYDAMQLVTESLRESDKERQLELIKLRQERAKRIRQKAAMKMRSYKNKVIDDATYELAQEKIENAEIYEDENKKMVIKLKEKKEENEVNENKKSEKETDKQNKEQEEPTIDEMIKAGRRKQSRQEEMVTNQIISEPKETRTIKLNKNLGGINVQEEN